MLFFFKSVTLKYISVLSINYALLDHFSLIMCLNEISNTRLHSISRGYKTVGKRHFFELTEQYFDREYFLKTVLHDWQGNSALYLKHLWCHMYFVVTWRADPNIANVLRTTDRICFAQIYNTRKNIDCYEHWILNFTSQSPKLNEQIAFDALYSLSTASIHTLIFYIVGNLAIIRYAEIYFSK